MDVLSGFDSFPVCIAYDVPGRGRVNELVADDFTTPGIQPIYESWPGWSEDIGGVLSIESLPANCRAFIGRLERELGVPIDIVSTAPDRESTIVVNPVW